MKFEFGINLKAAKQIGVTIPPNRARKGGSGVSMRLIRPRSVTIQLEILARATTVIR